MYNYIHFIAYILYIFYAYVYAHFLDYIYLCLPLFFFLVYINSRDILIRFIITDSGTELHF